MHGLNLKKTEAGTRPERLSSTNMGVPGLKKTEAGTRPERLSSTNMGVPGAWCHPEEDGDGDKAGALTYPQGTRRKKTEAGTRPERLSSTNMGCQVRGPRPGA